MRPHTPKQPLDLGLRIQQLKHAIRGDDQIEPATQSTIGDIAKFRPGFGWAHLCGLQLLEAAREHGRGAIETMDKAARGRERKQDTTRPTPQFQDRGVCRRRPCHIEGAIIRDRRIGIIVLRRRRATIVLHECVSCRMLP
jgi:hypothetical protein